MSRTVKVLIGAVVGVAVLVTVGPWVYINVIRTPADESFVDQLTTTSLAEMSAATDTSIANTDAAQTSIDTATGTWKVAAGSQIGYRVEEVLFGQNVTAVGRSNTVAGSVTVDDLTVTEATFVVDMTTIKSDDSRRDAQFESRIMDVLNFPTAAFSLDSPITLAASSLSGTATHTGTGTLTLRGTTKPVEVVVVSTIRDGNIVIAGEITIIFAEWNIPNPSIPGISTEDSGLLEFQLVLER